MANIAKHTVKHEKITYSPGQHVPVKGPELDRLVTLGAIEVVDNAAAEKETARLAKEAAAAEKAAADAKAAEEVAAGKKPTDPPLL